jgi:large exoprotein involved in heme utilization and adhesion
VTITDQGSGLFTTTAGSGTGGDISLRGSSIQLSNGGAISATSSGRGNAGNIIINAGNQLAMTNSSVTTEASQSSGGAIKITTAPSGTVELTNSTISASVLDGTGGGGSVNIDPQFVILQNSQILANAVFGPGGNINITTNLMLPDSASVISASSQFGQQGTILIQSPIAPASGKIIPLSQKPLIETSLVSQRCAASADGIYSSFTFAGRDSLPAEPGGWISSPLALGHVELMGSTATEPETPISLRGATEEMPVISLRRIAPLGFLNQSFAGDSSGGCTS